MLMYEHFPHTADLGLRVMAPDLETLFVEAARGLSAMVVPDLDTVRPLQSRQFEISGSERDYVLFDWLNELLYVLDTEHLLFSQFVVRLSDSGLTAEAQGEPLDPARHRLEHEVKAITYHRLTLRSTEDGFLAEVIVDI